MARWITPAGRGAGVSRLSGDRGAAMAEAALVSPIFILVIFAVLEFGIAYRDILSIGDATTDAARVGASLA